jgi:hypothetical protein
MVADNPKLIELADPGKEPFRVFFQQVCWLVSSVFRCGRCTFGD